MRRPSETDLRQSHQARPSWFRALTNEAKHSYLVALWAMPWDRRRSKFSRREIIQLLWFVLLSLVSVAIGLYGGVARGAAEIGSAPAQIRQPQSARGVAL